MNTLTTRSEVVAARDVIPRDQITELDTPEGPFYVVANRTVTA